MDPTLKMVLMWLADNWIALVAVIISVVALVRGSASPWWRNESGTAADSRGSRRWELRLVNGGKGDATNVNLYEYRLGKKGASERVAHYDLLERNGFIYATYGAAQQGAVDHTEGLFKLTWEQHPFPWVTRSRWFKPTDKTRPTADDDYDVMKSIY